MDGKFQELDLGLSKELWDSRQRWDCAQNHESHLKRTAWGWGYRLGADGRVSSFSAGVGFSELLAMCVVVPWSYHPGPSGSIGR